MAHEIIDRLSVFEVVEQGLDGDTRPREDGGAAMDLGVTRGRRDGLAGHCGGLHVGSTSLHARPASESTGQTTVIRAAPASCPSICPQRASAGRMAFCRYARRRPTVHQARPRALSAGRPFVPGRPFASGPARGATPARRDGAAVAKRHSGAGEDCAYRTFVPRVNLP